ncbi:MAG: HPr family phosphocarrier protein [Candidatus Gastranaerophilales bacterium]|nr:HPr family phosphocarrier protein [Candidatus Gastranaerophilales bacterium]
MPRIKIKLLTPELIADFINICSKYECDINLYDGRNIVDAKSLIGVFAMAQGKPLEVQAITSDENVVTSFIEDMKKFKV